MKQNLCEKIGALGIKRGKAFWNKAVLNLDTNRFRGGTSIILSTALNHSVVSTWVLVAGRAQFVICRIDHLEIGFLNIYAPNAG